MARKRSQTRREVIVSEWKEYKLGEIITTNAKSIGKNYPFSRISYLDTGSITCNKIDTLQEFNIDEAPSRAKRLVSEDDIVYSAVRPNQLHYGYIKNPQMNLVVSTGFVTITCDQQKINPKYLYYSLTQSQTTEYLHSIAEASTSAYPSLKPSDIEALDILLPPLHEQKRIASILSSLDDKIDLLTHQNRTLEAMAETLFRHYFNEKDNDDTIEQLICIQNGYAFKSQDFKETGANGVVKIKNISGGVINIDTTDYIDSQIADAIHPKFRISSGDILIAMTGAEIGKLGIIPSTDKSLWLNQRVGLLAEKYKGAKYLAYLQLKSDFGQDYIENTATGSAQPNISGNGIEKCGFPKLSESDIIEYSYQIGELYDKVIFNLGQISTLVKLRNILLPKLMNGEIIVNG